jgi:hypothetical protein
MPPTGLCRAPLLAAPPGSPLGCARRTAMASRIGQAHTGTAVGRAPGLPLTPRRRRLCAVVLPSPQLIRRYAPSATSSAMCGGFHVQRRWTYLCSGTAVPRRWPRQPSTSSFWGYARRAQSTRPASCSMECLARGWHRRSASRPQVTCVCALQGKAHEM